MTNTNFDIEELLERVKPYSYLTRERFYSLIRICQHLDARQISGDIVECGTYKGGSAAVMSKYMGDRHLWLYDSFQGMPQTTERDGTEASKWIGNCLASPNDVTEVMQLLGTDLNQFTIIPGWFHDTFQEENLPTQVALLHCDADWYDSVTLVLETFYDRVIDGGCIVLDDFGYWEGCREAFYDFCYRRGDKPLLERVGTSQAYWIKGRSDNRTNFLVTPIRLHQASLEGSSTVQRNDSGPFSQSQIQIKQRQELEQQIQQLQHKITTLESSYVGNIQALKKKLKNKRKKLKNKHTQAQKLRKQMKEYKKNQNTISEQAIVQSSKWKTIPVRIRYKVQGIIDRLRPIHSPNDFKEMSPTELSEQAAYLSVANPLSPLTQSSDVTKIQDYSASRLIQDWKRVYGIDITPELKGVEDIRLYQCNQSQLRFFYPFNICGSEHLYAQLEKFDWYYMSEKWEYAVAKKDLRSSSSVLEIGSGYGFFLQYCKPFGIHVKGLETNSKAVTIANEKQLNVENVDLIKFAQDHSEMFDIVCSFQVLEHVPNPLQFLDAAIQVLKPGGSLILGVPNANSFLKYQYCLLDMPPHHMHQWSVQTFQYLEKVLPLKLEVVKYEPLASYHVSGYVKSYGQYLKDALPFGQLVFNSRTLSWYEKILQNSALRSRFRGQSLYVRFSKI